MLGNYVCIPKISSNNQTCRCNDQKERAYSKPPQYIQTIESVHLNLFPEQKYLAKRLVVNVERATRVESVEMLNCERGESPANEV